MRPSRQHLSAAIVLLAMLAAVRYAYHRPAHPTTPRSAADAGQPAPPRQSDAGAPLDVPSEAGTPESDAVLYQRRDEAALEVMRDLRAHGRRIDGVQVVDNSTGTIHDNLRLVSPACTDGFTRAVARDYPLRHVGMTIVTCVRPGTREIFVTGVPADDAPRVDAGRRGVPIR